jgi:small subunit ribosomal protein S2
MVDTNCDPTQVDYAVPANDDATKSIAIITNYLTEAIIEGLEDRKRDKDEADAQNEGEEETQLSATERVLLSVNEDSLEDGSGEGAKKPAAAGARRRTTGARRTGGGGSKPADK